MNENIDLAVLLKDIPKGTKFWSPIFGEVEFLGIGTSTDFYPITIKTTNASQGPEYFTKEGKYHSCFPDAECTLFFPDAECTLFPSKDQRDWNVWAEEQKKSKKVKVTLHPFDRVLVRDLDGEVWDIGIYSYYDYDDNIHHKTETNWYKQCIPYNKETAHLIGTLNKCPIDYEIEFSKDFAKSE